MAWQMNEISRCTQEADTRNPPLAQRHCQHTWEESTDRALPDRLFKISFLLLSKKMTLTFLRAQAVPGGAWGAVFTEADPPFGAPSWIPCSCRQEQASLLSSPYLQPTIKKNKNKIQMQLSPLSFMINLITSCHFYHIPGCNREHNVVLLV